MSPIPPDVIGPLASIAFGRDGGFAGGALLAGFVTDLAEIRAATWVVAALTAISGLVAGVRMYETHRRR